MANSLPIWMPAIDIFVRSRYATALRTNSQVTSRYRIGNAGGDCLGRLFMPVVRSSYLMSVFGCSGAVALSKAPHRASILPALIATCNGSQLCSSVIRVPAGVESSSIATRSGLPIGDRAIWPKVGLGASRDRFCDLGYLF